MRSFVSSSLPILAILAACSSAPRVDPAFRVNAGDSVRITYGDGSASLSLRNQSSLPAEKAYSSGKEDPSLKVADDDTLERLLSILADQRFFEVATAAPHPRARAALRVEWQGRTYVRSRLPLALTTPEDLTQFNNCVWAFRQVYDNTLSYHSAKNIDKADLERLNEKLRRDAEARLREKK